MAMIFDGRKLAQEKEGKLVLAVAEFKKTHGFVPKLVSILIGDNPASIRYLVIKKAIGERAGIEVVVKKFSVNVSSQLVQRFIKQANLDSRVTGIMIQMPLPGKLRVLSAIAPSKDVDCLTTENLELLKTGKPRFLPATTKAVASVFESAKIGLAGKKIVIVGSKGFVGEPLFDYLKGQGFSVTGIDKETKTLGEVTRQADILISATGVPNLIKKEMIKKGAVVIDVGYPQPDVDFAAVAEVASFITPVPGGVGPLTVISLLENVLLSANQRCVAN